MCFFKRFVDAQYVVCDDDSNYRTCAQYVGGLCV